MNPHLQRSWKKHGASAFVFEILEYVDDPRELLEAERRWMEIEPCEFNIRDTPERPDWGDALAERNRMRVWTPEMRAKLSASQTGRKHSEDARRNMALGKIGMKMPQSQKDATRNRQMTSTTREKLKEVGRRNPPGDACRAASFDACAKEFVLINPLGETVVIKGLKRFCEQNNLNHRTMSRLVAREKGYRSHKGWRAA